MKGVRGASLVVLLLASCSRAFALNASLDVSQYAHTAWKIRDGFVNDSITAIAQTPDGYLWLGTERGLYRFDGVRAVARQPPNQPLLARGISSLLVTRDGALWIATDRGLARLKDRQVTQHLAERYVGKLVEDRDGAVWATSWSGNDNWALCTIQNGQDRCYGNEGGPGAGSIGLYQDSKGTLWSGTQNGLWRWKPGPPRFYQLPFEVANPVQGFAEDDHGGLLISTNGAVSRFVDGKAEPVYPLPTSMQRVEAVRLLRDRDGGMWIGSAGGGIAHVHHGLTDAFSQRDGLSGDFITTVFEDLEGNVWVATAEGLDRFRETIASVFSVDQGLSSSRISSVLASSDGSVWIGTTIGLNRWNDGNVTVYSEGPTQRLSERKPRVGRSVREVTGRGLPSGPTTSIFQDSLGRVWLSTLRGVGYLEDDRFVPVSGLPAGITRRSSKTTRRICGSPPRIGDCSVYP